MNGMICHLKIEEIIPNFQKPLNSIDDFSIQELAKSIKQHGIIQPIVVCKKYDKYEIIDGKRRYEAAKIAGLNKIPSIVKDDGNNEIVKISLIDDLQKNALSPIDEAKMYREILDNESITQEELANNIGKSQSAVANKLRLLNLPQEIQHALIEQEISERHARSLLVVKDKRQQIELLNKIKEKRMSVRELDSEIKNMSNMFIPEQYNNNVDNNNQGGMFIPSGNNFSNSNSTGNMFINPPQNNNNDYNNNGMFIPQTNPFEPVTNNNSVSSFNDNNTQGVNNPFFTNNAFVPPVNQPTNNPFSNIRMNTENQNSNPTPFYTDNNQNDGSLLNNIEFDSSSSFNINDYKLPGVDEPNNNFTNISVNENEYHYKEDAVEDFRNLKVDDNQYKYVEDNPNYVSVDKPDGVESLDDVINILKNCLDKLKNGKIRVDTEEIDFDDTYQITIKVDKKGDF